MPGPPTKSAKSKRAFDPREFLAAIGHGRKIAIFSKKQTIFTQGDAADAVFYIQKGKVRLTVVSKIGKEATLAILNSGDFFGEGGLAGQPLRMGSAVALTDCELMQIDTDVTGTICTKWNERESTWRKSGSCQSRGISQSRS
jgi:CRP/FNR family transcriptional regulator, cyclic AMP receptor protein